MAFYGCPHSGMIYDDLGRPVHQVPEHAREDFRRSASKDGIHLLDDSEPVPPPASVEAAPPSRKTPQP